MARIGWSMSTDQKGNTNAPSFNSRNIFYFYKLVLRAEQPEAYRFRDYQESRTLRPKPQTISAVFISIKR